jgi:hypothetical protein
MIAVRAVRLGDRRKGASEIEFELRDEAPVMEPERPNVRRDLPDRQVFQGYTFVYPMRRADERVRVICLSPLR